MAMRAAITKATVVPSGFRALLFSTERTSPLFNLSSSDSRALLYSQDQQPPAEPTNKLVITGLGKRTTNERLRAAFAKFGKVVEAKVVCDKVWGYHYLGFVKYETLDEAAKGIKGMDGKRLDGWVIFAEYARPKSPPPPQNSFSNPMNSTPFQGGRTY